MALLVFEDFDSPIGNEAHTDLVDHQNNEYSTSYGYNGGNGARVERITEGRALDINIPGTAPSTIYFGCRISFPQDRTRTGTDLFQFRDSGGNLIASIEFAVNDGTELRLFNQAGSNIGDTVGANFGIQAPWAFFEFELVVGTGANGTMQIRRNGVEVLNVSSADFTAGNDDVATITIGGFENFGSRFMYVNNVQVLDDTGSYNNTWRGEIRAEYILPTSDGNVTDWTPDTGSTNYTQVDEDPLSTSDYVQSGTLADIDLYGYPALSNTTEGIIAVDVLPYTELPDGGSRFLRGKTRVSATNYETASQSVVDLQGMAFRFEENPNTTAAWTVSGVDGAEFGYEVRDS